MTNFDKVMKIWSGPKVPESKDNNSTFCEKLLKSFRLTPEKVFQISDDEGTKLTYSEVELLSIRVAQNLKKFGIQKNDVVAVLLHNSTYAAPLAFGCALVGAPVNALLFRQGISVERITQSLKITKPKAIIVEEFVENTSMIKQAIVDLRLDCKIFTVGADLKVCGENVYNVCELLKETGQENKFEFPSKDNITNKSIVFIIPSSGSTGPPKSIALNGTYCLKHAWTCYDNLVVFSHTNFSWLSGVAALLFPFFNNGLRVVTKEKFNPKDFGRIIRDYKVTSTICSVESASDLLKSQDFKPEDFLSMREFFCGGERVPCKVREFLKSQLPVGCFGVAYGSTESGIITNFDQEADTSEIDDNVVGNLTTNVMCQIIEMDSEDQVALGVNQVGEIFVKSETMFTEYYGNEELTLKAMNEKGWYKTGDAGYFDDKGALHVHGRINDMITVEGKKVHLAQIEYVFESFNGVKGACVIDVVPGKVLSVLCTKLPESKITEDDLTSLAGETLQKMKFQGGIHIVDEIPRTNSVGNKVLRIDAKKLAMEIINMKNKQVT